MKHKLMAAMQAREAEKPRLEGRVEVDGRLSRRAALGRQARPGRGGQDVVTWRRFETTPERKPRRLRLTVVKGFRKREIATLAKRDFAAGSNIVTDGLSCWTAVSEAGCDHFPMVTGSGPNAAKWVPSPGSTPRSATSRPRSPAPTTM